MEPISAVIANFAVILSLCSPTIAFEHGYVNAADHSVAQKTAMYQNYKDICIKPLFIKVAQKAYVDGFKQSKQNKPKRVLSDSCNYQTVLEQARGAAEANQSMQYANLKQCPRYSRKAVQAIFYVGYAERLRPEIEKIDACSGSAAKYVGLEVGLSAAPRKRIKQLLRQCQNKKQYIKSAKRVYRKVKRTVGKTFKPA